MAIPALLIRTELDRIIVAEDYAAEMLRRVGSLDPLLWLPDDRIRDVIALRDNPLWPPARWASLALAERDVVAGRWPANYFGVATLLPATIREHHWTGRNGGARLGDLDGGLVH